MNALAPYPLDYQLMLARSIDTRLETLRAEGRTAELREMEKTLSRLYRSDFGACEVCGALIAFARIAADPAIRRCVGCERP